MATVQTTPLITRENNSPSVQESESLLANALTSESPRVDCGLVVHQRAAPLMIGLGRDHCSPDASFFFMSPPPRENVHMATDIYPLTGPKNEPNSIGEPGGRLAQAEDAGPGYGLVRSERENPPSACFGPPLLS
jgi:hypothetical protein